MPTTSLENSPETRIEALLLDVHAAWVEFANVATAKDAVIMDELARTWLDLVRARTATKDEARTADLGAVNAMREMKLKFMRARFLTRECDSFRKLPQEHRGRIAEILFEVP